MFQQRFKKCLEFRGKKPIDVARGCNVSKSCVSQYMNGYRVPKIQTIEKFAKFLNVNPFYLVGISNDIVTTSIRIVPDEDLDERKELTTELINVTSRCNIETLKNIIKLAKAMSDE